MANYRVKQRWLSGRGKKQFSSGDIVTERDFPDNIKELLAEGRIEVMEEEDLNKEDENKNAPLKSIDLLYLERKEKLMPFWEFLHEDHKSADFALWPEETFEIILKEAESAYTEDEQKFLDSQLEGSGTIKKILTEEDFELNPELAEQGLKVGDEIEIEPTLEETDSNKEDLNENENAEKKAIFIYNEKPIFTMEDISKPDLQACLLEATIPFKPSDNKDALWNALMNSMEQSQD